MNQAQLFFMILANLLSPMLVFSAPGSDASCVILRVNSEAPDCASLRGTFDAHACEPGRAKRVAARILCSKDSATATGETKAYSYSAKIVREENAWGTGGWSTGSVVERKKEVPKRASAPAVTPPAPSIATVPTAVTVPEPTPTPQEFAEADPFANRLWRGGNWRRALLKEGWDLGLTYKLDLFRVLAPSPGASGLLGNLDFKIAWNSKHWSGFVYGLGNHGDDPASTLGDIQVTSNIETSANTFKLYQAWLQYATEGQRFSILLGIHDLNSEFYVTETSGLFLNSSFGVGKSLAQTGANGPSIFPSTAPAVRFRVTVESEWVAQFGVYSAHAGDADEPRGTHFRLSAREGALLITEVARVQGLSGMRGKYGFGLWSYTRTFDHQTWTQGDGPVQVASSGGYFLVDQGLSERWNAFTRLGFASPAAHSVRLCWSAGLVGTGVIPDRPLDRLGLAIANVRFSDEYRSLKEAEGERTLNSELAIEFSYRFELLGGLAIQPDFQWVLHPGGSDRMGSVVSTRIELAL